MNSSCTNTESLSKYDKLRQSAAVPRLKMRVQIADSHVVAMHVARCKVFFALQLLLQYHDVLRSTLIQIGPMTVPVNVQCSNGGQQRYILPSVIRLARHKLTKLRINTIISQTNCKQRVVTRSSCFIARKPRSAQIYYFQVDDRLSAAHPTPHTMIHINSNSALSCVWLFFQPAVLYLRSPKATRGVRDNFTTRLNPRYSAAARCNLWRCYSTATMVARTLLNVSLYVHCLSCYH
jgi:hypothetical protein